MNKSQYYINQQKKSVLHWEKHRTNKPKFALKKALINGLIYGIGLYFVIYGLPTTENLYKFSIIFSMVFIFSFVFNYLIIYIMKEKYYLKTKKELHL